MLCGAIGMLIATQANFRTTYSAKYSLPLAFRTAYRAGVAMGFALVSLGLLGKHHINKSSSHSYNHLQRAHGAR
jgi:Na+/H+-translocating membrane pyrophosphatase